MITDEIVEKAALAMVNRKRCREGFEPITSLTLAYSGVTADLIRDNARAALDAVEADIRNVALEEARMRRLTPGMADWFWRDLDPDDNGESIHEAIHMMGEGVVCAVSSSFKGPSFFAAIVPTLDQDNDDTEELIASTQEECVRMVQERYAAIEALETKVTP